MLIRVAFDPCSRRHEAKMKKCFWHKFAHWTLSEHSANSIQALSPLLPLSLRRERFTLGMSPLPQDEWRSGKYFIVIGMLARQILVCTPKNHLKAIMRFINSCYAEGLTGVVNQCWKCGVDCSRPLYFFNARGEKASMNGLWTRKQAKCNLVPRASPLKVGRAPHTFEGKDLGTGLSQTIPTSYSVIYGFALASSSLYRAFNNRLKI